MFPTTRPWQHHPRGMLALIDQDLLDGKPNIYVLLIVSVLMVNIEVKKMLVD